MFQVFGTMFLIIAIVLSVAVRCVGAAFSQRIGSSIAHHPIAHVIWLVASLMTVGLLILCLWPRLANRPVHGVTERSGAHARRHVLLAFERPPSGTTAGCS